MSDLNSEVIGGRSLRNRKSLAAKNKGNSLIGNPYKLKFNNIRESGNAD